MKESVRIALSYVRSHAAELGIDPAAFNNQHFHVHVPAGAVPKDGPSAGVTMVTALASLLTGRPVRGGVGMTREVTLQGKVLPIGGVKWMASSRSGSALEAPFTLQQVQQHRGGDLSQPSCASYSLTHLRPA